MSAFTSVTVVHRMSAGGIKQAVVSAVGPSSYDSDGSVIDLSATTLGAWDGFNVVYSCVPCGYAAAADTQYHAAFVIGTAGAPATGKVVLYDIVGGISGANITQASGDLDALTFYFLVTGV